LTSIAGWMATGPPAYLVRPLYQEFELSLWRARGRRGAVPHLVKQAVVREYAGRFGLQVLVETGTYLGDMVWAVRRHFRQIHSIELDPTLHARAERRFRRHPHVHLVQGDSAEALAGIVAGLEEPALFWLDGHFSGGITARGAASTPILEELSHVFGDRRHRHVALIDDAGDFLDNPEYPSLDELEQHLEAVRPGLGLEVTDNIIRVSTVQPMTVI
jgi:hypothetical protein